MTPIGTETRDVAPLGPAARAELEAIYRRVEREIEALGVRCALSGRCCDFEAMDHRLFASTVEIAYVRATHREPFPAGSALCPFWKGGLCQERERRPLACRTYFCDERHGAATRDIYERYHREIRALADRHGLDYRYLSFVDALHS